MAVSPENPWYRVSDRDPMAVDTRTAWLNDILGKPGKEPIDE